MTSPTTDETPTQEKRKSIFPVFARPKSPLPFSSEPKEKRDKKPSGDRRRTVFGGLKNVKDSGEFPDRGAQSLDLNGLMEQRGDARRSLAPPSQHDLAPGQATEHSGRISEDTS